MTSSPLSSIKQSCESSTQLTDRMKTRKPLRPLNMHVTEQRYGIYSNTKNIHTSPLNIFRNMHSIIIDTENMTNVH